MIREFEDIACPFVSFNLKISFCNMPKNYIFPRTIFHFLSQNHLLFMVMLSAVVLFTLGFLSELTEPEYQFLLQG
jgi:hypothetical protein